MAKRIELSHNNAVWKIQGEFAHINPIQYE